MWKTDMSKQLQSFTGFKYNNTETEITKQLSFIEIFVKL